MNAHWFRLAAAALMVAAVSSAQASSAACSRQERGTKVSSPPAQETGKPKKEEPFALSGARSHVAKPTNVVARSEKEFATVWAVHARQADGTVTPIPKVDFNKYDVLAVFLGSVPTGGHTVEIGDIKREGKKAVVKVTHLKPGLGMMVIQSFTTPFAMKAVPKLPPTVTFDVTTADRKPPQ